MIDRPVLVTGAFGLVGRAVVRHLAGAGRRVVATDVGLRENRVAARQLSDAGAVDVRWADLTVATDVRALVADVRPGAIVHLAAVIPPRCYAQRELARRVNVGATEILVEAATALADAPRFVLASSIAVYGARNPHRTDSLLTPSTPLSPGDLYGDHKLRAETVVTGSGLEWTILRLGGVLSPSPVHGAGLDMLFFQSVLPADGRLQTVDVRDVARAFAAAIETDVTKEVFLVGGDESHRVRQGELGEAVAAAMGLGGVLPPGRPGDPARDDDWFATDYMDTARAQAVLSFQERSLPELLAEAGAQLRWRRVALGAAAPLLRRYLRRYAPYRARPGAYADPWGLIGERFGDPSPEAQAD